MLSFLARLSVTMACCIPLSATAVIQAEILTNQIPATASLIPVQLKTESKANPLGIDEVHPQFSWQFKSDKPSARNLSQMAYRVLVASTPNLLTTASADIWDSGRVESSTQFGVTCACPAIKPARAYYWRVMTWDQAGRASRWSQPARWYTGMLTESAWKAHWIAAGADEPATKPAREGVNLPETYPRPLPLFRRDLTVSQPIAQAVVVVSGLGQYELRVNGKDVTSSVMNPGWSDYRKRILYNLYDVTGLLKQGGNTLGVLLGNGMYNVPNVPGRYSKFTGTFGQPKFILQLMIRFQNGSATTIMTDSSWTTTPGPITFSSIYGGEDYDAQQDHAGWDLPGYAPTGWQQAIEVASPGGVLVAQQAQAITVAHTYTPAHVRHFPNGAVVYDLGRNFSGWPNIVVRGPAGSQIKLLPGELLNPTGHVTQRSNNARPGWENSFTYTLKGHGDEAWHPHFSYNGFRYVEVTPLPAKLVLEKSTRQDKSGDLPEVLTLTGSFLHDDVAVSGSFDSSDALFVQIHQLIDQAILSNMVSVLTDCPTREKLGWLEQTHLAATSIMYNYDVEKLYEKMADDMADAQTPSGLVPAIAPEFVKFVDRDGVSTKFRDSPEWGSAVILSPLAAYRFYGDKAILLDHYEQMKKYVDYLRSKTHDHMLSYGLGDWYDIGPRDPGESQLTGKGLTATAIYYQDLISIAAIAEVLQSRQDEALFKQQANTVKDSFNRALFHPDTNQYDRGSQTDSAMPLALGLVPDDRRGAVLSNLVNNIRSHGNHITAGDIGFHYVIRALTDGGRSDVIADLLSRTDSPSYGYQLKQGATSLTEAWDANPVNSQNHFMLGHAEEWFYRGPALTSIYPAPRPSRFKSIQRSFHRSTPPAQAWTPYMVKSVQAGKGRTRASCLSLSCPRITAPP
jgi:alpha-L-rhamnosidase